MVIVIAVVLCVVFFGALYVAGSGPERIARRERDRWVREADKRYERR